MNYILILLSTFIIGTAYYYMMESSIPKNSNCSFIASIWTDILAFITGIIIIYKGINIKDTLLVILGGALIVEHIWQLLPKFIMKKIGDSL